MLPKSDDERCTAKSKQSGERCKRLRTPGHKVCVIHGSRSPLSIEGARQRLLAAADPAAARLARVAQYSKDEHAAVKASVAILDRSGFHPTRAVELFGKDGEPIQVETIPLEKLSAECKRLVIAELEGREIHGEIKAVIKMYLR